MALLLADPSKVMLVTSKQGRDAYHLPSVLKLVFVVTDKAREVLASLFQLYLILWLRPGACPGTGYPKGGHATDLATNIRQGNTKGGSITVPLTSCLTGLD
jgi:hypothetical protein